MITTKDAAPAVVCFPFAGGKVGGSHISACKLIQSLDRTRYTPLVVLHHDHGPVARLLATEGITYELAPSPLHFGEAPGVWRARGIGDHARVLAAQPLLARFLRSRRVALVHSNEGAMHVTWAVPARLSGAQLVWHHRSSPEARGLRYLAPHLAAKVVSVSHFALSLYRDRDRARVVYSPFDIGVVSDRATARERLIAELGVPRDSQVIGFFGSLTSRKRPVLFVDAIAELVRRRPGVPVVGAMFGDVLDDGLDAAVEARAVERGVASNIRLMGFRYPPETWLAGCDMLAVTAVGEPFGRTLIEAMLLGTPVIAVDCGGNSEAIEDNSTGLLAAVDDASSIAARILELIDFPERKQRIAAAARDYAASRFGIDRHLGEIEAVYREILAPAHA